MFCLSALFATTRQSVGLNSSRVYEYLRILFFSLFFTSLSLASPITSITTSLNFQFIRFHWKRKVGESHWDLGFSNVVKMAAILQKEAGGKDRQQIDAKKSHPVLMGPSLFFSTRLAKPLTVTPVVCPFWSFFFCCCFFYCRRPLYRRQKRIDFTTTVSTTLVSRMKRLWRCVSQCPNAVVSILLLLPKQFVKQACLRMFLDLDLIGRFHIDYEVLCRWLLSVKKNYRNVTYHNWRHAFNVAQMMFAIVTVSFVVFSQSVSYWREHFLVPSGNAMVESFGRNWSPVAHHGLFVSRSWPQRNQQFISNQVCITFVSSSRCYNRSSNRYCCLNRASSPLAQLYTTSTMERHHFDQCLMILSSQVACALLVVCDL